MTGLGTFSFNGLMCGLQGTLVLIQECRNHLLSDASSFCSTLQDVAQRSQVATTADIILQVFEFSLEIFVNGGNDLFGLEKW